MTTASRHDVSPVSDATPRPTTADDRSATDNLRVRRMEPLPTPEQIRAELPLSPEAIEMIARSRREVHEVLAGDDDRLLVVVGPCSAHDPDAVLDYAHRLAATRDRLGDDLVIVMRVYFEKPRTTVGWKGLINDPAIDGTFDISRGLRLARKVLLDVLDAGVPAGCEFLETTTPQYLADTVSYGAIGARTVESQVHRQLVSGLSMPVGLKNGSDGDVQVAVDGCVASAAAQTFLGIDKDGRAAVVETSGNPDAHVILRGGRAAPNHDAASVDAAATRVERAGLDTRIVIDASHGNSGKDHVRQVGVAAEIGAQVAGGDHRIGGVMLESFLVEGRQEPAPGGLVYGQSITDACMAWATTETVLDNLAAAARSRRQAAGVPK